MLATVRARPHLIMGFEIRLVGAAPQGRALCRLQRPIAWCLFTFAVSGALAGLAGIIEVAGPVGHLAARHLARDTASPPIIVAFLGRLQSDRHPDRRTVPRR